VRRATQRRDLQAAGTEPVRVPTRADIFGHRAGFLARLARRERVDWLHVDCSWRCPLTAKRTALALVLLPLLVATACTTTTRLTATNPPPRPMAQRAPETVEVYVGTRPARPFVEVGLLDDRRGIFVVDPSGWPWPRFIQYARESAARVGCDAVVLESQGVAKKGFWGTCLLYTGSSPSGLARTSAR
jgi:hypothetical protein